MDNEIDRKIDVTAMLFLLVQNRQQTHDWTLIGSGANGPSIQEVKPPFYISNTYKEVSFWRAEIKCLRTLEFVLCPEQSVG